MKFNKVQDPMIIEVQDARKLFLRVLVKGDTIPLGVLIKVQDTKVVEVQDVRSHYFLFCWLLRSSSFFLKKPK